MESKKNKNYTGKKIRCYLAGAFVEYNKYADWRDFVKEECKDCEIEFHDPRYDTQQGSIATFVSGDLNGVESCDITFLFYTSPKDTNDVADMGGPMEGSHANAKGKIFVLCIDENVGFPNPFCLGVARRVLIKLETGIEYLKEISKWGLKNEFKAAYSILKEYG